ncbi:MAG: Gfo/Idh/MocA family oxidoreductase [Actinobacteria bacterium]|nr:Gfo/Idh/MocA family oxidoreductase [Actinomycetota bacterium]
MIAEDLPRLGLGVIGAGSIARQAHVPSYQALPGIDLVAVADSVPGRAEKFAAEFGFAHSTTDFRELVRRDDVDLVSVCTPPAFHAEPTIAALNGGKHVLCEKPMALDPAEAAGMVQAARGAGRVLAIDFQMRFEWATQVSRQLVCSGELGAPHYVRTWYLRRCGVPTWGAFTSKALNGGGALIDIGVHALDQALFVLGHPQPLSVWGSVARPFGNQPGLTNTWGPWDHAAYDVDDFALAAIRFAGDLVLTLEASWALRQAERSTRQVFVSATAGGIELYPLRVFRDRQGRHSVETIEPPAELPKAHALAVADFVRAVRTGLPPTTPGEHGALVARIVHAIYRSAEARAEIPL